MIRNNMVLLLIIAIARTSIAASLCSDGSAAGANGCCAATNECPPCYLSKMASSTGSGVTCTCLGGDGATLTINPQCGTDCSAFLTSVGDTITSSFTLMGCTACFGASTYCYPDTATRDVCFSQYSMVPGFGGTVSSSGTLQCSATPPVLVGSNPCFPSSALITKADGNSTTIDQLKEGDAILAADADGLLTADTVSPLSTSDSSRQTTFLMVTLDSGHILTLTPTHHLPVGDACCSHLKLAKDVHIGDKVWAVAPTEAKAFHAKFSAGMGADSTAKASKVTAVATVVKTGTHSPVMTHGTYPVVDGVVTAFDSHYVQQLASYGLPLLHKTGTESVFRRIFMDKKTKYIKSA